VAEGANAESGLTLNQLDFARINDHFKGNNMQLTNQLQQAAQDLGKQLSAEASVQKYVRLKEKILLDPEVTTMEEQYSCLYQTLIERQQNGEHLDNSDLDAYYRLKNQFEHHPLISARDLQLEQVKALFAQTAQHLTASLGIDFPTFARK
jgi:cell fate (sporulation/competence/biofilm development) regulator YlbF (YheA/YmcA/DUF963 family)